MRELIKKILKESGDWNWVKDVEASIPFKDVVLGNKYGIHFVNPKGFIWHTEQCGVANANDLVYQTSYVRASQYDRLTSPSIYCDDNRSEHYDYSRPCLQLSFYNDLDRVIHPMYWVAEGQEVMIVPYY